MENTLNNITVNNPEQGGKAVLGFVNPAVANAIKTTKS
jgi:hypothetical protein